MKKFNTLSIATALLIENSCADGLWDEYFGGPDPDQDVKEWLNWARENRVSGDWKDYYISEENKDKQVWLNYDSLKWTMTSYIQPQVHFWDRFLFDREKNEYTVDRFLDDLNERYGGVDSVLMWPIYPNIGLDQQNALDRIHSLPGGINGTRKLVDDFHERGVKVLYGYTPWEVLTRNGGQEEGFESRYDNYLKRLTEMNFDGINGDTMAYVETDFFYNKYNQSHPMAIEPENEAQDNSFWWSAMGWGYYSNGSDSSGIEPTFDDAPLVSLQKWLSYRGNHMVNMNERWGHNRFGPLQNAHFNGVGYESWEDIWGIWNGVTPRAGEAIRRLALNWRFLGKYQMTYNYEDWIPHTEQVSDRSDHIYGSKFIAQNGDQVYMIINRKGEDQVAQVSLNEDELNGFSMYNLFTGETIELGDDNKLSVQIESNGFATILLIQDPDSNEDLESLLSKMKELAKDPLMSFSNDWAYLEQEMKPMNTTDLEGSTEGMILMEREQYYFQANGTQQEPFNSYNYTTKDVQFPWEKFPQVDHKQVLDIGPFFIDQDLVTRKEFSEYLQDSGYVPKDAHNFLSGWDVSDDGSYKVPEGQDALPVTSITVEEATAFCNHYGKRLPHEYEWQYAAQGNDGRVWPWGNEREGPSKFTKVPEPCSRRNDCQGIDLFVPTEIGSCSPQGDSPFGMRDAVGNIWQFTDQFIDPHTDHVVLKGGSSYDLQHVRQWEDMEDWKDQQPGLWYFSQDRSIKFSPDQDPANIMAVDLHNKWMKMSDSFDRASTVGFRCVKDHKDGAAGPYHIHMTANEEVAFLQ